MIYSYSQFLEIIEDLYYNARYDKKDERKYSRKQKEVVYEPTW